jgi:hypothetical protein
MKKLFILVSVMILLFAPAVNAQDENIFVLGVKLIVAGLEHPTVSVGLTLIMFFFIIFGSVASGLRASPMFGGKGELDKQGKMVALAFSGILILGTFFIRKNTLALLTRISEHMPWFFALITSLLLFMGVRSMFGRISGEQPTQMGFRIQSLVAWIVAVSWFMLFVSARDYNVSIKGGIWGAVMAATIAYFFITHNIAGQPQHMAGNASRALRTAGEQAGSAQRALDAAVQAGRNAEHQAAQAAQNAPAAQAQAQAATTAPQVQQAAENLKDVIKKVKRAIDEQNKQMAIIESALGSMRNIMAQLDNFQNAMNQWQAALGGP